MTSARRLAYFLTAFVATASLGSSVSLANDGIHFTRLQLADERVLFGEVLDDGEDRLLLFDLNAGTSVSVSVSSVKDRRDSVSESEVVNYVPFATYAAWKLTQMVQAGRVESTVVRVSEDAIYIGRGHSDGIKPGQKVLLLGELTEITDPNTDEVLGSVREEVGTAQVIQVLGDRLSSIEIDNSENDSVTVARGSVVAIDRASKTVVVAKPSWKSEGSELRTGDEALFLHVQMISELVKYGFPVISRSRVEQKTSELASQKEMSAADVTASEVASELKADVLLESEILAKGVTGIVTVEATDMGTSQYLGVMNGSIRRQSIRDESKRSYDFARAAHERKKVFSHLLELEKRLSMVGVLRVAASFNLDESSHLTQLTVELPPKS